MSSSTGRSARGALAVATAALCWGTVGLVARTVQRHSGLVPQQLAFLRLAVAAVALLPAVPFRARRGRSSPWPTPVDLAAGLFLALNQLCYFLAIDRIGVAAAALLTLGTAPVLASGAEAVAGRRAPGRGAVAALGAAVVGLGLLSGIGTSGVADPGGVVACLVSACCFTLIALVGRARRGGGGGGGEVVVITGVAALALLPVAAPAGLPAALSRGDVIGLGYLGVGATAGAYLLYFRGLASVPASTALLLVLLEPVTASLLGVVIGGEAFGGRQMLGAALLLAGVAVAALGSLGGSSQPERV